MDLTKISLDAFLCGEANTPKSDVPNPFAQIAPMLQDQVGPEIRSLGSGYALHRMKDSAANVLLTASGRIVGCYWNDILSIDDDHQSRGLSVPLILEAIKHRELPKEQKLSAAGKAALKYAWEVANGKRENPWP